MRFSHEAMATLFDLHVSHADARYAAQAAREAFDLVDRLEQELSRFLPNSDVTRINSLAAGGTARVGAATVECLTIAKHLFELTGGAFDISLGSGLASVDVDPIAHTVRVAAAGVRLDLGGIGKGYAVDRVAESLEEWGLDRSLVHGGFSSVLALDAPDGETAWPLTISDPRSSAVLARLPARQLALGASGLQKGDHIVDLRTGEAIRDRVAAWVAVPRPQASGSGPRLAAAAVADALATACMVLPLADIEALCAATRDLRVWVLPEAPGAIPRDSPLLRFGEL